MKKQMRRWHFDEADCEELDAKDMAKLAQSLVLLVLSAATAFFIALGWIE